MCGIWGEFGINVEFDQNKLKNIVSSLFHRGPDGYGYFSIQHCALVHTRLSIIDLVSGGQPLTSYDNNMIGIVNGEIYDYKKTKTELEAQNISFKTCSDSEVLLNLFTKKGKTSLKDVHGEYAYIFFDKKNKKVFFGRDPFGVKPLYIFRKNNSIILASEIKAILSNESFSINEKYLTNYICRITTPLETLFQNIQHVYPGYVYEYDIIKNKISETPLGSLQFNRPKLKQSKEECLLELEATLKNSIKRRLVADVEVGAYLSGGVDSSLILALMCDQGARPKAFTVGFEDNEFDESNKAITIAKHLGVKHEIVMLNKNNFFDYLEKSIIAFESPIANVHGAAKNLLGHLASKHLKVVLSGEGADELFAGYAHHRLSKLEQFLRNYPDTKREQIINYFITTKAGIGSKYLCSKRYPFKSEVREIFTNNYPNQFRRIIDEKNAKYLFGRTINQSIHNNLKKIKLLENMDNISITDNNFNYHIWLDIRLDLLHYILANLGDRQEMSNSIEGRTPFLDLEVARLALTYSPHILINGLTEKYILKQMCTKYLPIKNGNEPKHAFFAPDNYFNTITGKKFLENHVHDSKKILDFLNWNKIEKLFKYTNQNDAVDSNEVNTLKLTLASTSYLVQEISKHSCHNKIINNSLPTSIIKGEPHVFIL